MRFISEDKTKQSKGREDSQNNESEKNMKCFSLRLIHFIDIFPVIVCGDCVWCGWMARSLNRTLGFVDGVCILISIIIGSGIFSSPGEALSRSGSPGAALVSWCISGLLLFSKTSLKHLIRISCDHCFFLLCRAWCNDAFNRWRF
jgi:hypothetical protein